MPKLSAGILIYKITGKKIQVFLVHPGGPFWAKKDAGAWSVPKGEYSEGDDVWAAAQREFEEETGQKPPQGQPVQLGEVTYGNKRLTVWAVEGDADDKRIVSNVFTMEWPPRSGQQQAFPEVDRAGWFDSATAKTKLVKGQVPLIKSLLEALHLPEEAAAEPHENTDQLSFF